MKVLKNNYANQDTREIVKNIEPYPRKMLCNNCESELEYEKSDMRMGFLGAMHIDCPLCGYANMLDDNEESITLTKDNVEFPVHFWHTSKETGAVDCCNNEEVKKYINKAIDYFRKNKDDYHWFCATGNMHISVDRYDGDEGYCVMVTNNYYETNIPFEKGIDD